MNQTQFIFEAIGTRWAIDIYEEIAEQKLKILKQSIHEDIELFDKKYSRFRDDSLVSSIAEKAGEYDLDSEGRALLDLYHTLYTLTSGSFTPLIGNILSDAGYDKTYSFHSKKLVSPPEWESVLHYTKNILFVKKPVLLDFGGIGKGFLIDKIGKYLKKENIDNFCIDAGGDILYSHKSKLPLLIGLENPHNTKQVIGEVRIVNQSICASAGNRRKWGKFHHIIDPHTLKSPETVIATWVIADTAVIADAIATCLFLVPPEKLTTDFEFEYCIISSDNTVARSSHFPVKFYTP